MKYQGVILNLHDFYGTVVVKGNTFSKVTFKYNNCEEVYNSPLEYDSSNLWGTPSVLQAKTLIYINVRTSPLEIYGNTFSN